jgi:hypothetical protein
MLGMDSGGVEDGMGTRDQQTAVLLEVEARRRMQSKDPNPSSLHWRRAVTSKPDSGGSGSGFDGWQGHAGHGNDPAAASRARRLGALRELLTAHYIQKQHIQASCAQ